jgi:hypothetical protein
MGANFCFLIDGLDEFEENNRDHADLVKILRTLEYSNNVKMCVSSRPWTIFNDEFGDSLDRQLRLQDLTRGDIERYVHDKFHEHKQFRKLMTSDPAYKDLITEVHNRAQGVFLWVYLVVRSLLEGLTYNDSIKVLQQRLLTYPDDLDKFFKHIIDSIPSQYRSQATQSFQIAASVEEPQTLVLYSYLDRAADDQLFWTNCVLGIFTPEQLDFNEDHMRRQLEGRSKGLLEIFVENSETREVFKPKVDFLHRTVRDYMLGRNDFWDVSDQKIDPYLIACGAKIAELEKGKEYYPVFWGENTRWVHDLCLFSREASKHTGSISALRAMLEHARSEWEHGPTTQTNFIALAAQHNLLFYLDADGQRNDVQSWLKKPLKQPILDCALQPINSSERKSSSATIEFLLREGANPNEACYGSTTVWRRFLTTLEPDNGWSKQSDLKDLTEIVRLMLAYGASRSELLLYEDYRWKGACKAQISTIFRVHGKSHVIRVSDVIETCFPHDAAASLLDKSRKRTSQRLIKAVRGWSKRFR